MTGQDHDMSTNDSRPPAQQQDAPGPKPSERPMSPGDEAPPGTPGTGDNLCPRCSGSGRVGEDACPECDGTGTVVTGVGGA
jgi:hypothetical protein